MMTRSDIVSHEPMTSGRQVGRDQIAAGLAMAALALGAALLLKDNRGGTARRQQSGAVSTRRGSTMRREQRPTVRAGRELNRAAGVLALSVLADSAMEHYRADFFNRAMYTPLVVSTVALAVSVHGVADQRETAHAVREATYIAAALTGLAGTAFHAYNVTARRQGGLNWQNLFYGAPLGAPFAILLSGLLGAAAERVRGTRGAFAPSVFGFPSGRGMAALAAMGLAGTAAEAGLLHFRGAYHNPFMFLPVSVPPLAALLMAEAALGRRQRNRALTRWWLRLTAAVGFAGMAFHAYGVHRNMGGWRNWRQNLLSGPPIPAPPAFTGMALAGLASLNLLESRADA
jgi:hypothetical protein